MSEKSITIELDSHIHSEGSYDGKEPVDLILEHSNDIELDAIAITDHDNIDKSLEAYEKSEEFEDVIVIPGIEVSSKHGHVIGLGVEEDIESGLSYSETVERIRDQDGVVLVPHPFQSTRHGVRKKHIDDCDAVEIYNAWFFTGFQNKRARKFAEGNDYPKVGSSDAHTISMIGRAYTEVKIDGVESKSDVDYQDIVDSLAEGGNKVDGMRAPLYKSTYHYIKAAVNKTGYYTDKILGEGIEKANDKFEIIAKDLNPLRS